MTIDPASSAVSGGAPALAPVPGAPVPSVPADKAHRFGVLAAVLGVLCFTPDALVMRLVNMDPFALACLRGVFGGVVMTTACWMVYGAGLFRAMRGLGVWGLALAGLEAMTTMLFCLSIAWTTVANAMIAFAATPMMAAVIARIFLKERVAPQTAAAIAVVACGLGLVTVDASGQGATSLKGVAAGLASALAIGLFFVLLRKLKAASAAPVIGPGWLLGACLAFPFATWEPLTAAQWGGAFLTGGVIMPIAIGLITWGSRHLPAAEVSMFTLLEVVTGPLLVWAVLGEEPGPWTLAGGAVVLGALAAHSTWRWRHVEA